MVVACSAVEVTSSAPHRVTVSVTGMTVGQRIRVHRVVGGIMTPIRGGYLKATDVTSLVVTDNEAPFGVPVFWRVRVNEQSPDTYFDRDSSVITITNPTDKVWLTDAITGLSAAVTVLAWDKVSYSSDSSVYRVGGRNVVVSGASGLGQFSSDIKLITDSVSSLNNLKILLANCTSDVIQLRSQISDGRLDESYLSVTDVDIERARQKSTDERRYTTLTVVETEAWPYTFTARGSTYQQLLDLFTGETYADVTSTYATYLALEQADLS